MKNTLRLLFIALIFATTGLFAQAATDSVSTTDQAQHQTPKVAKKKHRKHKKKAAK